MKMPCTLFSRAAYSQERGHTRGGAGEFTPKSIVEIMLRGKEKYASIFIFIHSVLQGKKRQTQLAPNGQ